MTDLHSALRELAAFWKGEAVKCEERKHPEAALIFAQCAYMLLARLARDVAREPS